jgi:predicted RNA-binding protein Jag
MTLYLSRVLAGANLDLQFNLESQPDSPLRWVVRFTGPDVPMLTAENGKLLQSIGYLMAENFGLSEAEAHVSSIILDGPRPPSGEPRRL